MSKRIILGHVIGAHGIKGEVVVRTYTDAPESLGNYGPLNDEPGKKPLIVENVRATSKGAVVRLRGIADRTTAESLKGLALSVPRGVLPVPAADQYYLEDLIGMTAIAPSGETVGTVVGVQNFGAGDLIEIRLEGGTRTEFVPFNDPHVPTIDLDARRMTVVMPVMIDGDAPDDAPPHA